MEVKVFFQRKMEAIFYHTGIMWCKTRPQKYTLVVWVTKIPKICLEHVQKFFFFCFFSPKFLPEAFSI